MSDIILDIYKLTTYAQRIDRANARISKLDSRLDKLYFKVGLQGLADLIQADSLTGYSWRLRKCRSYLQQVEQKFSLLEKNVNYDYYISTVNSSQNNLSEWLEDSSLNFWFQGFKGKVDELAEIFNSDESTMDKINNFIGWIASYGGDAGTYKEYFEWLSGKEYEWPDSLKSGFDLIKYIKMGTNAIGFFAQYGIGFENGDVDLMLSGADKGLDALKSCLGIMIENGDSLIDFKGGLLLDYGKNMVSNWLYSLKTETKTSEVYWNTFANSAIQVFNDTVCNTPTLAIAYMPAEMISSMVGFDLQGAYENVSSKKGFAAVTDTFSQMNELFMENASWENWKSGMGDIIDGIGSWFK